MNLILNIDTSGSSASIALASEGNAIGIDSNMEQRDHATWIHQAIERLLRQNNVKATDLSAVAVTIGPGSYTGLRVGLSTAKGLCFGLSIPLITENTLRLMAFKAVGHFKHLQNQQHSLFAPMIDARRMEVFTAVFNSTLDEVLSPQPLVLDTASYSHLDRKNIVFFGNGAEKFKAIVSELDSCFPTLEADASDLVRLSFEKFLLKDFSDIAYSEPLYLKEFYSAEKTSTII